MSRKVREIWTHFDKKDNADNLAVCKYCNQKYSFKSTTDNLSTHLKISHAAIYLAKKNTENIEFVEQGSIDIAVASTSAVVVDVNKQQLMEPQPQRKKQRTMQAYTIKKLTPDEKKRVDRDLLDLFISDYQPFRIVEDKGFQIFVKNIPGYTLPSRKTISSTMIPALYTETLNKTKQIISRDALSICLTTDCWTSSQTESYIGVTAHYIDADFEPQQILLECKNLNDSHTSTNLSKVLKTIMEEWNITHKINFAISDNARNIVKAIETELDWKHYGCYAHTLNLIVTSALKTIEELLEKIKSIVTYFKRSINATDMLLSYQIKNMADCGEPKRLIQNIPTRWNSVFFMLRRFTLLKEALKHCMALIDRTWPDISTVEWQIISEICTILQPFEEITSSVSGDNYLTGSMVIVVTNCLRAICDFLNKEEYKLFNPVVVEICTSLQKGLRERFSGVEHCKTFGVCTLLDPRFKLLCFKNEQAVSDLKKHVHLLIMGLLDQNQPREPTSIEENTTNFTKDSAWSKLDDFLRKNKPQGNAHARAIRELQMYLDDEMLPHKNSEGKWTNPSQWWRDHKVIYPNLSFLFKTKCNRLKAKKVEQLAFLNANLPKY